MPNIDATLRHILSSAKRIVVIGIKDDPSEDAFLVPRYLHESGYQIFPVNPKLESVLGNPCVGSITEISGPIHIVNLFRATSHIPGHIDEILSLACMPDVVWMQLGICHEQSAERLRAEGIRVVQDLCIMVEHRRLLAA
jgi:predicted CoA-binding protein